MRSVVSWAGLPVALALSGARTVHAAPCAPSAALGGDADAVAQVGAELARLGDAIARDAAQAAASGCRFVVAAVAREPGGAISVAVHDGARSEDRRLSDASLAAEWIDSWLHDAVLAPPALVPARDVDDSPHAPAALHATAPAPRGDRVLISASGLDTLAGGSWLGATGGACVRTGAFCFGARLGYAQQDEHVGATGAARTDLFALATASWSHALGHAVIEPELGAGVGRLATDRDEACAAPGTNGMPCAPPLAVYVGDHFHAQTYSPRLAAALRFELPVADHVWLEGSAGVMLSPLAHTDPYPPNLPMQPPVPPELLVLPGEPLATVQLGVGLRVGVP